MEQQNTSTSLQLPVLSAGDMVLFPTMLVPLTVSEEQSIKLIDDALSVDKRFAYFLVKGDPSKSVHAYDLYEYGTLAEILKMLKFPDGSIRILIQGLERIKLKKIIQRTPYLIAEVEQVPETAPSSAEVKALTRTIASGFLDLIKQLPNVPEELQVVVMNQSDPVKLSYIVTANLNIHIAEKQKLLETGDIRARLQRLNILLNKEIEILKLGKKIQSDVQGELEKVQKEHILREQMKAIQKELGESDERERERKELEEKVEKAGMTKEIRAVADEELKRMMRIMPGSPEYTVSRTYIEWLVSLPWSVATPDKVDLAEAKRILDADHFDLEKVKERILEFMAVRKLRNSIKGPILCFLGPPGVGKTSLGMSIARAMGRKFVRISLGGVRDEAEIRGHRRTYIGALPGRIIQSLRKAGSNNPLFMLDEIDKLGADFRGDPSSALLEVLDPEQNFSFSDHYLDVPFNLANVMFITTANVEDTIPPALYDRMEVLELPGYTEEEKLQIARRHLIPKQLAEHGLTGKNLAFSTGALRAILANYTREAGLRNLERNIATVCRKAARRIVSGKNKRIAVTEKNLGRFLGAEIYSRDRAERTTGVGVATGLAWTRVGGDILYIESTKMPGSKSLTLTGSLGDVMKESAQAALSYLRSKSDKYGLHGNFFAESDLHIHVPAGAIPKDGPSAGVTIAASLYSLLTGKKILPSCAMTGEITLRGKVLPVGGIKEKMLAAMRAGIDTVILPEKNRKDLVELPKEARDKLHFKFASNIDDVLRYSFNAAPHKP